MRVMRQKNKQLYGIDTLKNIPPMISTHSKLIFVAMLSVLSNGCAQYFGGPDCVAPANANDVPVSTNYPDIGKHEPEYYLVKKDDTLYAISLLFDLDYGQLAQWNQIAPPSYTIRIGQKIRLSDPIWKKNSDLGSRGK